MSRCSDRSQLASPTEALELAEETFRLPRRLVGHGTLFMLRIRGTR
jgi:hypothetical protein